ncbi:MAG TPA: efflux RND transporter permease subunit, partial [Pseudomonadales bacterium]|nr:efflux RND transporter permease subunit [Pseudomonadales bacterium]
YALLFAPVLGSLVTRARPKATAGNIIAVEEGRFDDLKGVLRIYARILQFTTRHPIFVVSLAVVVMVAIVMSYSRAGLGMQFFTNVDPTLTGVNVSARGNYSAAELRDIVTDVEKRITHVGYIKSIYTRSGSGGISHNSGGSTADQIGSMFVELSDRHTRKLNGFQVEDLYRKAIAHIPGVRAELQKQDPGPPVGKDIQIELVGTDLNALTSEAKRIHAHLNKMDGLTGVDDTTPVPGIEWEVKVDRAKAAMMGADVSSVGAAVQLVTNGVLVGKYRPDDVDNEVDIRVRYPEKYRSITELDHLRIPTREGSVPISSFVQREAKPKISTIHRQDGNRVMYVRADTKPGVLADDEVKKIQHWVDTDAHLDPSIRVVFRGANEEQNKSFTFIGEAFTLALALMGILLITQFNSFYQATLILSAVVMSTVGVLLGLLVLHQPFSAIMTGVGIVALAGIIVNNNIVLIDTYNYLKAENPGWSIARVVVQTGCQRIRPVFLTTFTTGFGLLPMACGVSIDLIGREVEVGGPVASFWVQLASAIVFGLTFATVLTLIVTPAMLIVPTAIRDLWSRVSRRRVDSEQVTAGG